jgi:F-type H+-transporting ATPase subunit delta
VATASTGSNELAGRYAAALFDLADEGKRLDEVADDLRALKAAIAESEDLRKMIRSPLLSRDDQARAMAAIMAKLELGDLTSRFVSVVARNRRLFALPGMIEAYLSELSARRGEVTADVATAHALSDAQRAALEDALAKVVGGKVAVEARLDPSLIGGMVVRVGSRMFDSSLKTKLQKLQIAMKGAG